MMLKEGQNANTDSTYKMNNTIPTQGIVLET